jgi:hypothetical protein
VTAPPDLVLLASYPKSGNTWVRLLLESLAGGGRSVDINHPVLDVRYASDRAWFDDLLLVSSAEFTPAEIEAARPAFWQAVRSAARAPLVVKLHDAWTLAGPGAPVVAADRCIYVLRDPRSVACSVAAAWGLDADAAVDLLADPAAMVRARPDGTRLPVRLGGWSSHVAGWTAAPGPRLVLRYEDILADPVEAALTLADFLGWPVPREAAAAAAAATRFEVLAGQEAAHGFAGASPGSRFFRQGRAEAWQGELAAAQAARIECDHGAVMRRFGYL